ncbi:MAG: hypothetical protein HYX24_03815 [Candidatus Aenigmarchaeota archaeon]|nr:hypothetical protein [Candidatus Aenigmarchaeota archaeon]
MAAKSKSFVSYGVLKILTFCAAFPFSLSARCPSGLVSAKFTSSASGLTWSRNSARPSSPNGGTAMLCARQQRERPCL